MVVETLTGIIYVSLALIPVAWAYIAEPEFRRIFLILSLFFTALGAYSMQSIITLEYSSAAAGLNYIFITLALVISFILLYYGILAGRWVISWLREASSAVRTKWRTRN